MRREVAASAGLQPPACQVSSFVGDHGADGIWIRFLPDQMNSEPVVLPGRIISKQDWSPVVHGNQNVDGAIIVKVSKRQPTIGHICGKDRAALCADVFE